ncbi:MAG TPA: Fis family transcriptional regulator [Bacteroidales bacterium]|nr:Fis family transcriptional regulator [Bacteroidales bacterium]
MTESAFHGTIQHDGTVKKVDGSSVLVSITSNPACSGCHAEGLCGISGKEEKTIDIRGRYNVSPGDSVTVLMEQSTGFKAVVLSYLVPLVIVVASLVICNILSFNELMSGLISISLLAPWYLILYLFRNRINRSFTFKLKT